MVLNRGTIIRSLVVFSVGAAVGAAGGALVYKKLQPSTSQQAEASRPPASRTLAPPVMCPEANQEQPPALPIAAASPASSNEAPTTEVAAVKPAELVTSNPAVVSIPEPLQVVASNPSEGVPAAPTVVQEFFGVPVGATAVAPAAVPASGLLRLRLMNDRCVAGFDAKSSVLDFSGWTKALTGELTYEPGRPVETARGSVSADPATLDTGDADRDKELRDVHLEVAKFPLMKFEISTVKMTTPGTVDMCGTMEFHGRKHEVTIPCAFKLRLDGFAYVAGEIKVKMSDFGIKPPTKLGIIKVEDEIRVWFEIWAEPVKEPTK